MIQLLEKIDMNLLKFIHDYPQNVIFDRVMPVITFLGDKGLIWILISLALIVSKKYRKIGIMTLGALVFSTIIGEGILKHLIRRSRPFLEVPSIHLLIAKPLSYSFPSGHTAAAFAAAGILATMLKKYRAYVIALALLIAFSRMYLFVHYPTDIIGGIIVGLICSKTVLYFFELVSEKLNSKQKGKGGVGSKV